MMECNNTFYVNKYVKHYYHCRQWTFWNKQPTLSKKKKINTEKTQILFNRLVTNYHFLIYIFNLFFKTTNSLNNDFTNNTIFY